MQVGRGEKEKDREKEVGYNYAADLRALCPTLLCHPCYIMSLEAWATV